MNVPHAPLAGMRVLDLSQQLPGPYATLLLASLGARIVKVEPPAGDAARVIDPEMFDNANPGKTSLRLDLKAAEDRERLHQLIAEHDVLVEGFRPGVAERLGFGYETARGINPGIVYCSISGFGQEGPLASEPSHDLTFQMMAGCVREGELVDRIGIPWVDLGTATSAAFAIAALWGRGTGAYLDMSMLDTALAWSRVKPSALEGPEPTYGTFQAQDGWVAVAILEDHMWQRLCTALAWEEWADDPGLATYPLRRTRKGEIHRRLTSAIGALTIAAVLDIATRHDLPIRPLAGHDHDRERAQVSRRDERRADRASACVPLDGRLLSPLGPLRSAR